MSKTIVQRVVDASAKTALIADGVPPFMAKLYAARGVKDKSQLTDSLKAIIPPQQLTNADEMARLLADAIGQEKRILVVGDYDADGATATAVAVKGLDSMGAKVGYLVPNRFEYGYGLTPEIVDQAAMMKPDILLTVDNGIASVAGVAKANNLGMQVLITDHHLPGNEAPAAACIVNPNQHGCDFPSKHLAGVGVMFYVLLALRAELRQRQAFVSQVEPNLTELLDLVALGTVADLVKLDDNNRILVEQGLRRIRGGAACYGVQALLTVAGRNPSIASAQDLGFYAGPRLNAAGRLDDMHLGIACLLAQEQAQALAMAQTLQDLNVERRSIEATMQEDALALLQEVQVGEQFSLSLYEPNWHQGVVGILASRIKEKYHRPVIAFAETQDGILKGSGRSIPGLHLRDALDLVSKQHPDLMLTFGGHAMAAGLSIPEAGFSAFRDAFEQVVKTLLTPADLQAEIQADAIEDVQEINLSNAQALSMQVWGQGFPQPIFSGVFSVVSQRVVGQKHLKLKLLMQDRQVDAIYFGFADTLPADIQAAYYLQVNEYQGLQSLQLQLIHVEPRL